jgi:Rrf2 family nitric oxide-sensitive transcriptional repressor
MRLTTFTDYSLRVLIYLAVSEDGQPTIREIAQRYDISRNHLMKVVQELSQKGYLRASRGKHGGLRLGRPTTEIKIGTLVRDMENDLALVDCLGDNSVCVLTPACKLRLVFAEALDAFFVALDDYTLEDIVSGRKRAKLLKILSLE